MFYLESRTKQYVLQVYIFNQKHQCMTQILTSILQYASGTVSNGEHYMTYTDLIQRYLQLLDVDNYNEYTLQLFGSSVDTSRDK